LVYPKGFSILPVLVVASGITKEVEHGDFFTKIIDISALLDGASSGRR
jgi:hypothetical protein